MVATIPIGRYDLACVASQRRDTRRVFVDTPPSVRWMFQVNSPVKASRSGLASSSSAGSVKQSQFLADTVDAAVPSLEPIDTE